MEEIAIKVESVSKDFVLPHERHGTVKSIFTGLTMSGRKRSAEIQHALKNVSFEVKKGEFFGIVGRNGSGKSTLLKILAGIYQPSTGRVQTEGKLVPFIELGVGFNPELTGRENVYLNGAMLGFSRREIDAMYKDIVGFAELKRFMDQKLKNYSSGMQVRLAFSMAIRAKADILLVDEVLAVGDADFQRKCYDYFRKLKKNKQTVIFVSHDMAAVREYCDKVILIEDSEIIASGDPLEVTNEYTKLFLDSASDHSSQQDDKLRWGNAKVQTKTIVVKVKKDSITIEQRIACYYKTDKPVIGFRIRDAAGKEILGTNSRIENRSFPELEKGQEVTLKWSLPNILSDGEYVVDPAILEEDGITVADWWDDAVRFSIKKSRRLPYAIDPEFRLTIE